MAQKPEWYEAEQGVIIRRPKNDNAAAAEIADALDHGWAVLSHNVVKMPTFGLFFFVFGFLFGSHEHVVTFVKRPA